MLKYRIKREEYVLNSVNKKKLSKSMEAPKAERLPETAAIILII